MVHETCNRGYRYGLWCAGILIAIAAVIATPATAQAGKVILLDEEQQAADSDEQVQQDRDEYLLQLSLEKGTKYLDEGRFAEAKAAAKLVLNKEPENQQAQAMLAKANAELQKIQARTAAHKPDAIVQQNMLEMEYRYYEANCLLAEGNYDEAATKLEMAIAIGESVDGKKQLLTDAKALLEKAEHLQKTQAADEIAVAKENAQAVAAAFEQKQAERREAKTKALFEKAKAYYQECEYAAALECVNAVLEADADYAGAQYLHSKIKTDGKDALAASLEEQKERSHRAEFARIDELRIPQTDLLVLPEEPRQHDVPTVDIPETDSTGPAVEAIQKALQKKISVEFNGAPLADAIDHLCNITGCNMVVDPRCKNKMDTVSGLNVTDTEMVHVLNMICRMNRLQWAMKDEMIVVSDRDLEEEKLMRVYDIADLCVDPKSFKAKKYQDMTPGLDENVGIGQDRRADSDKASLEEKNRRGREIVDLICSTIAQGTWRSEAEGGKSANTIQFRNGKLVVTHNSDVHKKIMKLLEAFRQARALQVSVLARYIDINKDYIERAGIDWSGLDNLAVQGISDQMNGSGGQRLPSGGVYAGSNRLDEFGIPIRYAPDYLTEEGDAADPSEFGPTRGVSQDRPAYPAAGETPSNSPWDLRGRNVNLGSVVFPPATDAWNAMGGLFLDIAFLSKFQVRTLIEAVEKHKQGNILTSPRVTCFNGQRANLVVAELINYIQTYDDSGTAEISTVTDGVVLEVKPYVSADQRYVTMELLPSVTELRGFQNINLDRAFTSGDWSVGGTMPLQLPEVYTRSVETTVSVPDGGTILIGGLSTADEQEGYSSVPLLSKIPVVKYLFMNWGKRDSRTSLVVLVTADILIQNELEPEVGSE